jgi:Flp pilus assembly protein TadG
VSALQRLRRRAADDAGTIAPAVPILVFVLLLLGGLVLDASRQLNARGRAVGYAEEAARAGASAINLDNPQLQLDEDEARRRVQRYCDSLVATGTVSACRLEAVLPNSSRDRRRLTVQTRVELEIPATLLGLVGVTTLQAAGDAKARPYEGVFVGDAGGG